MICKIQTATLLALAFVCANIPTGSTSNAPRCLCLETIKFVPFIFMEDFLIIPKEGHCPRTQIILAVNKNNVKMEVCLTPEAKQGKALVACWERIGNDLARKGECIVSRRRVIQ
ncbi:growth-regulated alpha protein-like [Scyliorhinus canicula]|uniref:growth-regulated alpha protein-like n=1 Tax=Scyliorhinus canicula TaxID=7830 RepID=UPI0018F4DC3F|nr:growth-regulated alpha protein-like [Scyliorhinus canicula]